MKPYGRCKRYGPYTRKDGRKHVVLVFPSGKKKTVSWPKYLIERQLGKKLDQNETIHHIDENIRNNKISNLEIIDRSKHIKIHRFSERRELVSFICPICGTKFSIEKRYYKNNQLKQNKAGPFCSKVCSGKYGTRIQYQ